MFIIDGVYRNVDISGLSAPILEGTVLTETGAIASADGSDAFGIVPQTIYEIPPTKLASVVVGGTIDLRSPANANVEFSEAVMKALGADINFVQNSEAAGGGGGGVFPVELIIDSDTHTARSSKTSLEIISAFNSGLLPYLNINENDNTTILPCTSIMSTAAMFSFVGANLNAAGNIIAITCIMVTINADGTVTEKSGWKTF